MYFADLIPGASGMAFMNNDTLIVSDIGDTTGINRFWKVKLDGTREELFSHGFDEISGLTFDRNGTLFGINAARQELLQIDLEKSQITVVGSTSGIIESLAAISVPEPASFSTFAALAILAVATRRRRIVS